MNQLAKQVNNGAIITTLLVGLIACQPIDQANTDLTHEDKNFPGKGVRIRSAHSTWIEEKFQTEIVNLGLEELGYQVEPPQEIDYPPMYLAIANGDLDYTPTHGKRAHAQFFENSGGLEKLERVGVLIPNTIGGYQIDKKTADQYKITNLEQLKKPEIAKLFDSDGNGKANLIGCNPGWGCELIIEHHLDAYDLRDTVEHNKGEYIALMADTISRYEQGESVLYFVFDPHWLASVLKVEEDASWLEVPFTSLPKEQGKVTEKDTSVDGKNLGFAVADYQIVANKQFLAANPVAKRWFELVKIPLEDVSAESLRIKDGENKPEDIRRHAQEWVEKNQELFDSWVEEAKKVGDTKSG
ncbi:MAG: glycine betaine/L-proline ABC transporter substrate-binding protein ProX [Symploca sp. SIO2E6]|nr:glycine betaine/L-proline ABC transporter substrate-binding protein ProX [Symploca sp. SIO2E6]